MAPSEAETAREAKRVTLSEAGRPGGRRFSFTHNPGGSAPAPMHDIDAFATCRQLLRHKRGHTPRPA